MFKRRQHLNKIAIFDARVCIELVLLSQPCGYSEHVILYTIAGDTAVAVTWF